MPDRQQRSRNFSPSSCLATYCPATSRGVARGWHERACLLAPSRSFRISWEPKACSKRPKHPDLLCCPPAACQTQVQTGCSSFRPSPGHDELASTGDHGPLKPHVNLTIVSPRPATATTKVKTPATYGRSFDHSRLAFVSRNPPTGLSGNKLEAHSFVAQRRGHLPNALHRAAATLATRSI